MGRESVDFCSHLFQRVASFLPDGYCVVREQFRNSSHLFQRVASFLHKDILEEFKASLKEFSSLSESGFIPTEFKEYFSNNTAVWFSSLSESGFIPTGVTFIVSTLVLSAVLISFREWLHSYNDVREKVRQRRD